MKSKDGPKLSDFMERGIGMTRASRSMHLFELVQGNTTMIQADPVGAAMLAKKPDLPRDNSAWKYALQLFPELNDQIIVPEIHPGKLGNLDIIAELEEEPVYQVRSDGRPFLRGKVWHIIDALTNARVTRGGVVRILRDAGY